MVEVRASEGKGEGIFATQDIPVGTIILREHPAIKFDVEIDKVSDSAILSALKGLTLKKREQFYRLHEGSQSKKTKLQRILYPNAFGDSQRSWLYSLASKFNHSCTPNARHIAYTASPDGKIVTSQRRIAKDEEIYICYDDAVHEIETAVTRSMLLKLECSFDCTCPACIPGPFRQLSDMRRTLIKRLRLMLEGRLPGLILLGFCQLGEIVSQSGPLTTTRGIEYTFYLARLREAEAVRDDAAVANYINACKRLGVQVSTNLTTYPDTLPLASARCMLEWASRAVQVAQRSCSVLLEVARANFLSVNSVPLVQARTQLGRTFWPDGIAPFAVRYANGDLVKLTADELVKEHRNRAKIAKR